MTLYNWLEINIQGEPKNKPIRFIDNVVAAYFFGPPCSIVHTIIIIFFYYYFKLWSIYFVLIQLYDNINIKKMLLTASMLS